MPAVKNGEVVVQSVAAGRAQEVAGRGSMREATPAIPARTEERIVVREAAEAAADRYAPEEVEEQADAILEALVARLDTQTRAYTRRAMELARKRPEIAAEIGEPIGPVYPLYPYWNILLYGPFQNLGGPKGPFLPHKIIAAKQRAFMWVLLWRNPACMNWVCPAPSAEVLMSALTFSVSLQTINLTNVEPGPTFGPWTGTFKNDYTVPGFDYLNAFRVDMRFPTPPDGQPHLYEINAVTDVIGPVKDLPFAGFSTWVYDPDIEPAIFPPPLRPDVPAQWQHDIPARLMVYTP